MINEVNSKGFTEAEIKTYRATCVSGGPINFERHWMSALVISSNEAVMEMYRARLKKHDLAAPWPPKSPWPGKEIIKKK